MLILTDRDLKALLSLSSNWRRRYLAEVARLIEEDRDLTRQGDQKLRNGLTERGRHDAAASVSSPAAVQVCKQ